MQSSVEKAFYKKAKKAAPSDQLPAWAAEKDSFSKNQRIWSYNLRLKVRSECSRTKTGKKLYRYPAAG